MVHPHALWPQLERPYCRTPDKPGPTACDNSLLIQQQSLLDTVPRNAKFAAYVAEGKRKIGIMTENPKPCFRRFGVFPAATRARLVAMNCVNQNCGHQSPDRRAFTAVATLIELHRQDSAFVKSCFRQFRSYE
jgi:hypothetical protein